MRNLLFVAALFTAIAVFRHDPALAQEQTQTQTKQQAVEPLLDILTSELEYTFEKLQGSDSPPYYINFRVTDTRDRTVSASFGLLTSSTDRRERIFKPQIRLGTPDFDNFRTTSSGMFNSSASSRLPLDDDTPDAIRQAVWGNIEGGYRNSITSFEKVRADDKVRVARDDRAPDWSEAAVERYYEAPLTEVETAFDKADMERRVKAYSAVFSDTPGLLHGTASINFTTQRRYFVSSEGASVVQNSRACRLMINATLRTGDGMDLPLYNSWFAFTPDGLPSDEKVLAEVRDLAETLTRMASSPIVTPYTGPALMSGEAAGVFFHEIFGHRIEGQRMKSDSDGQTFKKMVGEIVLPKHFSVYDDPTLANFGDSDLYGHYLYDEQGVKARRVDVVRDGVLNEFLMTRTPIDEFSSSNGHARADTYLDPVSRQSNLVISTSRSLTDKQLRAALIKEAKAQQREFGLYFKAVTGGFTQTGRYSPNSFNVTPLEVYKIYVDGRPDELVRGVDLIGTPLSMFANIVEAGGETEIFTGVCGAESGGLPVTAVSPQILVKKIEVQRKAKSSETPPILERPDAAQSAGTSQRDDQAIFRAMQTELDRNMKDLKMENSQTPFKMSYTYTDMRSMSIDSSLGELRSSTASPQRGNSVNVLLGDSSTTSDINYSFFYAYPNSSAIETDEGMIKREFWLTGDARYKQAVSDMAQKLALRRQNVRSPEEEALPDIVPVEPVEKIVEGVPFEFDKTKWERRTEELSAVFAEYPSLYNSAVGMFAQDNAVWVLSSDGVRTRQPVSYAYMWINASVRTADGEVFNISRPVFATSDLTMPSQDSLLRYVHDFAQRLSDLAVAPKLEGYYMGPVLFTGQSVFSMFDRNLINSNDRLLAKRMPERDSRKAPDNFNKRIGQRVLDEQLSVVNHSTMRTWNGVPLLGYYEIDADGVVPPASLTTIENGILRALLNGRVPTTGAPSSTGSNRLGRVGTTGITPGTLEIAVSGGRSVAELEKELLALAAADGLEYAYIVEGDAPFVWRIDVATGRRTLYRGAALQTINTAKLRRIAGVSTEREVRNYLSGQTPASMIHPSAILMEDIEIGVMESKGEKPLPIINPLERD